MLNLVFQMGKSEMERKGNFGPSYLSFPVPFRPFQINPAFLSLSEKNGQLSGKGNIAFLSLTCMGFKPDKCKPEINSQYETDDEEFGEPNKLGLGLREFFAFKRGVWYLCELQNLDFA